MEEYPSNSRDPNQKKIHPSHAQYAYLTFKIEHRIPLEKPTSGTGSRLGENVTWCEQGCSLASAGPEVFTFKKFLPPQQRQRCGTDFRGDHV